MSKLFSDEIKNVGLSMEEKFDMDNLEESIEELKVDLSTKISVVTDAIVTVESMQERLALDKMALEHNVVTKEYLILIGNTMSLESASLGLQVEMPNIDEENLNKSLEEMIITTESAISSTWDAIKSFFKAIWNGLKKLGNAVSKFFGFKEKEIASRLKMISELEDLDPFELDSEKLVKDFKKDFFTFFTSGFDLASEKDIERLADTVMNNDYLLTNKEILIKGVKDGGPGKISTEAGFKIETDFNKFFGMYGNGKEAIVSKVGDAEVKCNVVTGVGPANVYICTLYSYNGNKEFLKSKTTKLVPPTNIDKKFQNAKFSRLTKSLLSKIENSRLDIIKKGDKMSDSLKNFEKDIPVYIKEALEKGKIEGKDADALLKSSITTAMDVVKSSLQGITEAQKALDKLNLRYLAIYKKRIKK